MEKQLEVYLHQHIPLSQAMGVTVLQAKLDKVVLAAPFSLNINHKKTVFGGSLHAVATLACWSLVHLNIKGAQIVITKSDVEYLLPVDVDFQAVCMMPDVNVWGRFLVTLQRKGKARIQLSATIHQNKRLCIDYRATFAAIRKTDDL
jgi:thioesterase domain-containing protein